MKQTTKSNLRENLKTTGIVFLFIFLLAGAVSAGLAHNCFGVFLCATMLGMGLGIVYGRHDEE